MTCVCFALIICMFCIARIYKIGPISVSIIKYIQLVFVLYLLLYAFFALQGSIKSFQFVCL